MRRTLAALVAVLLAGPAVWAGEMLPDTKGQPGAMPPGNRMEIEGKIQSVDGCKTKVTLEDGTTLTIPDSLRASRGSLTQGATVKATYQEKGGQKVATTIEVRPQETKPEY